MVASRMMPTTKMKTSAVDEIAVAEEARARGTAPRSVDRVDDEDPGGGDGEAGLDQDLRRVEPVELLRRGRA